MANAAPAFPQVDLHDLSIAELEELCRHAQKRIKELQDAERKEAFRKLERAASELGLTKADLAQRYGTKKKPRAPKYRNPAKPSETWSGRGRKPVWVEQHLSQGGTLEELRL